MSEETLLANLLAALDVLVLKRLPGGDFEIISTPGEGTHIDIRVPLQGNGRREYRG